MYIYTHTHTCRVVWVFGPAVFGPIEDVTPTYLTRGVLGLLRECDHVAHQLLVKHSETLEGEGQKVWLVRYEEHIYFFLLL